MNRPHTTSGRRSELLGQRTAWQGRLATILDELLLLHLERVGTHDPVELHRLEVDYALALERLLVSWYAAGGGIALNGADAVDDEAVASPDPVEFLGGDDGDDPEAESDDHGATAPAPSWSAPATAPPAEVPPAVAPGPPASAESLARLRASGLRGSSPEPTSAPWEEPLQRDLSRCPDGVYDRINWVNQRTERLAETVGKAPLPVQRQWLEWMAALVRAAQGDDATLQGRARPGVKRLAGWSGQVRCGIVHGLALDHLPRGTSWEDDVQAARARLAHHIERPDPAPRAPSNNPERALNALGRATTADARERVLACLRAGVSQRDPRLVRLASRWEHLLEGSELSQLRKAVRDTTDEGPDEITEEQSPVSAEVLTFTVGKVVELLGGSPRPHAVDRWKERFGFAELTWHEHPTPKTCHALAERVASGSVHMVVEIRNLSGHLVDHILKERCKQAGAPFLLIDGYGAGAFEREAQRFLARRPEG